MNDHTFVRGFFKSKYFTAAALVVIALLVVSNITILSNQVKTNTATDNLGGLTGTVLVQIRDPNGTVVSQTQNDTITNLSYDYIACMVFGSTCGQFVGNSLGPYGVGVSTATTLITTITFATVSAYYPVMSSLDGLALSSGSQTSSAFQNTLTTNGLAPLAASVTHSAGINTPIVTITGSWTFSGSSQAIQSIGLVPAACNNDYLLLPGPPACYVVAPAATMTDFAYENFATQTLTTGQSIGVTWTFSM